MQLHRITTARDLAEMREEWNRLAGSIPFDSWEWQTAWWETFGSPDSLAVLCVREQDRLRALLPAWIERSPSWGTSLRLLGTGPVSTDYVKLLACEQDVPAMSALVAEVLGARRSLGLPPIDVVEFEGTAAHGNLASALATQLTAAGFVADYQPLASCWRVDLTGGWDGYLSRLQSGMRRKMRKAFQRVDSTAWNVELAKSPTDIERAWPDFVALHQRRFVSRGERGCFADPRFDAFLRLAVSRLARRNLVSLATASYEGQPVAVQLYLHADSELQMYQSGVHPDFMEVEPGFTLFAWILREAASKGFAALDLLRGDEPYKAQLGGQPIALQKIRLAAPRWSSLARFRAYQAARFCKRRLHSLSQRTATRRASRGLQQKQGTHEGPARQGQSPVENASA